MLRDYKLDDKHQTYIKGLFRDVKDFFYPFFACQRK